MVPVTVGTEVAPSPSVASNDAPAIYRRALDTLREADVPFLMGGAFAMRHYTGIKRDTKDLDLFVRRTDVERALAALASAGYRTEITNPVWLAKAVRDDQLVDLIFGSDNSVASVDDLWFAPPSAAKRSASRSRSSRRKR